MSSLIGEKPGKSYPKNVPFAVLRSASDVLPVLRAACVVRGAAA
jgi:hypothetical protein